MDKPKQTKDKLHLSLDYRVLSGALGLIIIAMVFIWQPWADSRISERTIEVTGQATVTAVPDEFVFYPTYEFKDADKQTALAALNKKSEEISAKLKELGVASEGIKTNSAGYDYPVYKDGTLVPTYTLNFTITVSDKDKAQKVQDYLFTTTPTGTVSPQANFSDAKKIQLENSARDKATQDARSKADQSAKNLGFSIGDAKTVKDGTGFGGTPYPVGAADLAVPNAKTMTIQPGENSLTYSVTVTYFVK